MDRAEEAHICKACGVQFSPHQNLPSVCPICSDERQAVPKGGQQWTTHTQLKNGPYMNKWTKYEPGLYAFNTEPKVGIGQRAFLIQTAHGNILWDCVSLLDDATIDIVKALGGLKAIAISHPHYYANNSQWSSVFGNVPVYIHEKDKKWVMWEHENVKFWSGETLRVLEGATLIHLGGHFAGGQILHWAEAVDGKGALLSGDIIQVNALDRTTVSVMRSYPNYIPLSASHVRRIAARLEPWAFERVYGGFWNYEVMKDGKARVEYSLQRYIKWLTDDDPDV
jgi:glyoxylase-like metal-dependent hydrolase (beta-lactamase superfamily II)